MVAGLRQDLAARRFVEQFKTYKLAATSSAVGLLDPAGRAPPARRSADHAERGQRRVQPRRHQVDRRRAPSRKRDARKQRDLALPARIKVALARLGERDQLAKIEKLPFDERIGALDRYLSAAIPARPQPGKP